MNLIRYAFAFIPILLLLANSSSSIFEKQTDKPVTLSSFPDEVNERSLLHSGELFNKWNLESTGLSKKAFEMAEKGYTLFAAKQMLQNGTLLTIIDFSKPSSQKRLFVIDMATGKVLINSLVAHGKNSGYHFATAFSNKEESYQSSLGFYITLDSYTGENGYSLKLKGCETGINDKAFRRAIVLHGAEYVSEKFIRKNGYLGRSHGCPAVPLSIAKEIINVIKGGSCMFLYHPTKKYNSQSKILNS